MSPGFEAFINIFVGLIIFVCLLFLTYITTRFIGQKATAAMKSKYIKVIESISLGIDKNIYLVQIDKKYIVIATSGKTIQYLTDIELENLDEANEEINKKIEFTDIFANHLKTLLGKKQMKSLRGQSNNIEKDNVSNNVGKIKDSIKKLKVNGKGGDENVNV
ncbi:MAG: flagellar protein FliO/FliZ [Clostridiales bacterium]|jgi:flagellar protein FliO/FliZ|nr:flagellar protein FliO/FliZ [Clostridiales bacterium]MDK2932296.1 flagellar protein FliO/FliZ [Clostridiales bacterium]